MKVHSNIITADHVAIAAATARMSYSVDMQVAELCNVGSRKRSHGVTFRGYALDGNRSTNSGIYGAANARAATWDAWGYFIAEMFKVDPDAIVGQYDGVSDFGAQCRAYQPTGYGDRLDFLAVVDQSTVSDTARVEATLRTHNPNEPGAEWSVYDLSQALDISPTSVQRAIYQLNPGSRYVGGTSKYLYSIDPVTA